MNTIARRIEALTQKILQYAEQEKRVHQSLSLEQEKVSRLKERIAMQEEKIKELEEKNKLIQVAGTIAGKGESNDATKVKINELVREIDKCIALLNG